MSYSKALVWFTLKNLEAMEAEEYVCDVFAGYRNSTLQLDTHQTNLGLLAYCRVQQHRKSSWVHCRELGEVIDNRVDDNPLPGTDK